MLRLAAKLRQELCALPDFLKVPLHHHHHLVVVVVGHIREDDREMTARKVAHGLLLLPLPEQTWRTTTRRSASRLDFSASQISNLVLEPSRAIADDCYP
jgi:hypothetical protein